MMARLLALDIDDTLTGSGADITEANAEAVAWARQRGALCTIITGRRYAWSAENHAETLGLSGPIGVHYGRRVVEHPGGRVLVSHPLPQGCPEALLRVAKRFPEAVMSAFLGDDFRFDRLPPGWDASLGLSQYSVGNLEEALLAADEVMTFLVTERQGQAQERGAQDNEEGGAIGAVVAAGRQLFDGKLEYYFDRLAGREGALLTVISSAADKGTALLDIARRLGVHPDDTVAMGDSLADIPMLRAAGIGVAMPCSREDVRLAADLVVDGDHDDAVARAIRALF